jgi:hypothetical protein
MSHPLNQLHILDLQSDTLSMDSTVIGHFEKISIKISRMKGVLNLHSNSWTRTASVASWSAWSAAAWMRNSLVGPRMSCITSCIIHTKGRYSSNNPGSVCHLLISARAATMKNNQQLFLLISILIHLLPAFLGLTRLWGRGPYRVFLIAFRTCPALARAGLFCPNILCLPWVMVLRGVLPVPLRVDCLVRAILNDSTISININRINTILLICEMDVMVLWILKYSCVFWTIMRLV